MTNEYFEALKADILKTYADDLCEESVADIQAATSLAEFINVLNKYTAFLNYKNIPKIDWVRKWFGDYKYEAEKNGCYIDSTCTVVNPTTPITLYGTSDITLIVDLPHIYQVTTQDESMLTVSAFGVSVVNVRQKDDSDVLVASKDESSKIKIRKV